jgi:phospholipid/cholesterol/gamma-HCH transport system ATP-binding protein
MALFKRKGSVQTPKIHMADVSKTFGKKRVLHKMDLDVYPGESLVIIGGSGTGKSVTLKCILGLLKPDSGKIEVDGKDVMSLSEKEHEQIMGQFGMLFQNAALFDSLTVWENVAFSLIQNQKIGKAEAKKIAIKKLAQVGLKSDVADVYPADLSGGMRKRVGLARAIATNPEVIFFDEPTTGLDPIMSDVINDLIRDTVKKLGATALTITHDMNSARKIADRIAMLYEGKIIWVGTVKELDKTKNPYVRQFVAGSAQGPIQMEVKVGK